MVGCSSARIVLAAAERLDDRAASPRPARRSSAGIDRDRDVRPGPGLVGREVLLEDATRRAPRRRSTCSCRASGRSARSRHPETRSRRSRYRARAAPCRTASGTSRCSASSANGTPAARRISTGRLDRRQSRSCPVLRMTGLPNDAMCLIERVVVALARPDLVRRHAHALEPHRPRPARTACRGRSCPSTRRTALSRRSSSSSSAQRTMMSQMLSSALPGITSFGIISSSTTCDWNFTHSQPAARGVVDHPDGLVEVALVVDADLGDDQRRFGLSADHPGPDRQGRLTHLWSPIRS